MNLQPRDTDIVAFVDESFKPVRDRRTGKVRDNQSYYAVAAALTFAGDLASLRDQLDALRTEIGYPLHYRNLSTSRRRVALKMLANIDGWDGYLYETPPIQRNTNEHRARAKLLEAAFVELAQTGAHSVILESRNDPRGGFNALDQRDHDVLQRLQRKHPDQIAITLSHQTKAEPVLAIADLLAGARTDALCVVDIEPYANITHRVRIRRIYL